MMGSIRRFSRVARQRAHADAGFGLTELLVAMSVFLVVIAIVFGVLLDMTRTVRRTEGIADASDQNRRVFLRLDKQIPFASAVNLPVRQGAAWYLEFQTSAGGVPRCDQWRLDTTSREVQHRSWTVLENVTTGATTANPANPAWSTVAVGASNDLTATSPADRVAPFRLVPASSTMSRQSVVLQLVTVAGRNERARAETRTRFVARNTSTSTVTNIDNDGNGVSDTQVCQEVPR